MKSTTYLKFAVGLIAALHSYGTSASETFEHRRQQAAESAIFGCSRAIEDGAIDGYVKRRAAAGNPVASAAEARAEMESIAWWNEEMVPALRKGCGCLYEATLNEIQSARTDEELNAAASKIAGDVQTPSFLQELESRASACFAGMPAAGA